MAPMTEKMLPPTSQMSQTVAAAAEETTEKKKKRMEEEEKNIKVQTPKLRRTMSVDPQMMNGGGAETDNTKQTEDSNKEEVI